MSLYSSYPLYDSYLPMQDLSGAGFYYPETLYLREQTPLMDWSMAPMERGLGYPETLYWREQMPLTDRSLLAPMERGLGYMGEQMPLMDRSIMAPTESWLDYDRPSDWGMRSRELAPKEDRSLWRGAMGGMTEMGAMGGWQPRCTMRSIDEGLLVEALLPGVKLVDIELRLVDGDLVLSGERKEETTSKDEGYWSKERSYGKFRRRMWLPEGVQLNDIRANFNNGVLQVIVPLPGLQSGERLQQQQQLGQEERRRMEEPTQTYAEWSGAQAQRQAEPTGQTVVGERSPTVPRSEEAGPVREEGTREETKPLLEKKEKEKEKLERRSSGIFIGNQAPTTGQSVV